MGNNGIICLENTRPCIGEGNGTPLKYSLSGKSHGWRSLVGCSPWGRKELDMTERLHFHFHFYALEKEMATHSSVLAWRIPGMGSHRVRHDWSDLAVAVAYHLYLGFPGGSEGKESVCNAGDTGSIPGLGWSPGEGNGCPLQYSWLENSMDRGAWWATVPGSQRVGHSWVTNTFTTLSDIYNIGPL